MSFLATHMPDSYRRVSRTLGTALVLGDADAWHGFTIVISARLKPEEHLALAWAVLRALPPEQVVEVANTVLPKGAGSPLPPLFDVMDEASFWSDLASSRELEAYCLASFNRMYATRQNDLLSYPNERKAA